MACMELDLPVLSGDGAMKIIIFKSQGSNVWHDAQLSWNGPSQLQAGRWSDYASIRVFMQNIYV